MFNWFWKWLGYHVCEEFTQWAEREWVCTRAATSAERAYGNIKQVKYRKRVQERRCTLCGKIEQRLLSL